MAQQRKRRRKKRRLESKYLFRRMIVAAVPLVLIVTAVWALWPKGEKEPDSAQTMAQQSGPTTDQSSAPEESEKPEPEPVKPVATAWNLLLVNASNPLTYGYEESIELETISDGYQVDKRIADNVLRMFTKAKGDGISLLVCSAYRSVEKQEQLFGTRKQEFMDGGMDEEEAIAATLNYTSKPGTSEHHTGLTLDIVTPTYQNLDAGYAETPAAKWLLENAADFGFILRYPQDKASITQVEFEPWHYRYVGEEHAKIIMEKGWCLEEYLYAGMPAQGQTAGGGTDAQSDSDGSDSSGNTQ